MKNLDKYSEYTVEEDGWTFHPLIEDGKWQASNLDILYGMPVKDSNEKLRKVKDIEPILAENSTNTKEFASANSHMSGARLRFVTDATQIYIKTQLNRAWAYRTMNLFNSSGFDIYQIENGKYMHVTVTSPLHNKTTFLEFVSIKPNCIVEIYLPSYNAVLDLEIGVPEGSFINVAPDYSIKTPIVFYGNSITQGASASRSGVIFPNIISRELDADIINYSFSGACKGELALAVLLSKVAMSAMVIDYTRNAPNVEEFIGRYPTFYRIIRQKHPNIPVILLGGVKLPDTFDDCIRELYESEAKVGKNTFFISQKQLLNEHEIRSATADSIHYTDLGMFRIAQKIINILKGRI